MPIARFNPGAGVADLRARDQRRTVVEAGRRGRAAGALRDVLIDLAVLVRTRPEALDRGTIMRGLMLLDPLPGEAHAVERARSEILDEHVAGLDQRSSTSLPRRRLRIERDRALVVVQHCEVELSTSGTSRSWPRVMSPSPGRSTLITSAPNQASSCVQVGPDCTWVKSRIFTRRGPWPWSFSLNFEFLGWCEFLVW